jgi:hypothetical protein
MRVFVLLFNARTENEGIHTIQLGDRNKVLMFESEDDATRFGVMLEAQDFPEPAVEAIDDEEIKEFCIVLIMIGNWCPRARWRSRQKTM